MDFLTKTLLLNRMHVGGFETIRGKQMTRLTDKCSLKQLEMKEVQVKA